MNMHSRFLIDFPPCQSLPSMLPSYKLLGITFVVHSDLPAETGYLVSSGQCYELAFDGDGLRIVRQFPWPQFKHEIQPGLQEKTADGWSQSFLNTLEPL
jgi:hypothetical protein